MIYLRAAILPITKKNREMNNEFDTVLEALNELKKEGYTLDFNLKENCLVCSEGKHFLTADDFHVDSFYRFEGMTDPADESIVYAISSKKLNVKGVLVNAFGIYSDAVSDQIMSKFKL